MAISISQFEAVLTREEVARLGEEIYEREIRARLEPDSNAQVVAVHLPSHEYFLGQSLLDAVDRLRQQYPDAARDEIYARGVSERTLIHARTPRMTAVCLP